MQEIDDRGNVTRETKHRFMKLGHFDLQLKYLLTASGRCSQNPFAYCYISPPMGNYSTHPSGCDPKFSDGAGRPSCWQESWCCPGTRSSQDPKNRDKWLCQLTSRGNPDWISKVDVEKDPESLNWKTFWMDSDELRPRPNKHWLELLGKDDPRVQVALGGRVPVASPRRVPVASLGRAPVASPGRVPDASPRDLGRVPVASPRDPGLASDGTPGEAVTGRKRRALGFLVLQRAFRFWEADEVREMRTIPGSHV